MSNVPEGFNSKDEFFADLEKRVKSRRSSFDWAAFGREGVRPRGTVSGRFGASMPVAIGSSSTYDEAYGPSNRSRKGYSGPGAVSFDEGLSARRNARDDAAEKERAAKEAQPKKKNNKKKSK